MENLPKLGIEASIYYARIARPYESHCRSAKIDVEQAFEYVKIARKLLKKVRVLCEQSFQNADFLRNAVEESSKLLRKE